jgi:hypothetical protein
MSVPGRPWTRQADVVALLRKRWDSGSYLTAMATGQWQPIEVPLHGPTATQLAQNFGEVQDWAHAWSLADPDVLRLEQRTIGGRIAGANRIPARVRIDGFQQLCRLLGTTRQARRYEELLSDTGQAAPELVEWVVGHPMRALKHEGEWRNILATYSWLGDEGNAGRYIRQIAVPGVDTKFIEQRKGLLADLLDTRPNSVNSGPAAPRGDFAARYGFRGKPEYVRFRHLDASARTAGFTELTVRTEELQSAPSGVAAVYVVENEITYLALPSARNALAILGSGYRVGGMVEHLPWLSETDLVYSGDIDTHGFAILNALRKRFPHARSVLMDRPTLLAHREQWVTEPAPTRARLDRLTADERELYQALLDGDFGPSVRLEQERIQFPYIERAMRE